jgi:pimeloyl-ACP methyl ester carboxylesterase
LVLVVGLLVAAPAASGAIDYNHTPVIFVHGFSGSGAQFESQQMRLTSNGYPEGYIFVFEYDSPLYAARLASNGPLPQEQVLFAQLDQLIAHVQAVTHQPKVDLLAHSLGTPLMQDYLNSSPQRAANVAHYVNIDGATASHPPGGVPTLALWGTKGPISQPPGRRIKGAENVDIPDSSHVQTATSPLSFRYFYEFFNQGEAPTTTQIVPQTGTITIAGRDLDFPDNDGLIGATVQLWNISQQTGYRIGSKPIASFSIGASGDFGPVKVQAGRRYEFAEVRPGFPTHHFYYEPFLRTDHLVRLLESDAIRSLNGPPDSGSVGMVIIRYKELWGDQGSQSDILRINGLSVCNSTTCPLSKEVNALFAADFDHDGKSNPQFTWAPLDDSSPYFISSVDVYVPAQTPPEGDVTVTLRDRGAGPLHTITFPNFPSTTDDVTVQLDDFTQ